MRAALGEVLTLRERGLDSDTMDETTSDKVLFATVTDPEGNAITLVEQRRRRLRGAVGGHMSMGPAI
jgi:hypothetical protein